MSWLLVSGVLGVLGIRPSWNSYRSVMAPVCFQNQLLTKGMVILRDKIRFYEGESRG